MYTESNWVALLWKLNASTNLDDFLVEAQGTNMALAVLEHLQPVACSEKALGRDVPLHNNECEHIKSSTMMVLMQFVAAANNC